MNLFTFTGNLGKDAEVKFLSSGTPVCEFSVAVKSGYGDKEKTNWVRCAMFGKKAEGQLPSYLQKGTQVAISGELELQEWEGQNGKGAALSVRVENLDLIGGKPQGQQPQQNNQGFAPQQNAPQQGGYQNNQPQGGYQNQAPQQQGGYAPQGGFNPNQNPTDAPF
ncbi:single-strand DNA binding protein [Pseudoalteromonas phage PS_L5]|nr:single-strand DNA binding protein [Pseudoalteromonas phage PS_L5]